MSGKRLSAGESAATTAASRISAEDIDRSLACPSCSGKGMLPFYEVRGIPAHSCLLMETKEEARDFPRGDLRLGFCPSCGFIANTLFDVALNRYSQRYEETQHFSPRFNEFARDLAGRLVRDYGLEEKRVLEIGCGKGEFLVLLCEMGAREGIGLDPGYRPERTRSPAADRIRFIQDFYSEEYAGLEADFILCRHTLEHIHTTRKFLEMIRRSIGDRKECSVFFELPDVQRVLEERAFWDLYYEHCSYFSLGSLARLFRLTGFDVTELYKDYGGQYLMIGAVPADSPTEPRLAEEDDLEEMERRVLGFRDRHPGDLRRWREQLRAVTGKGRRVAIWGSGSKGVSYLTTLGIEDEVEYVVDINPFKHGKYMPGSGHRIVPPEYLRERPPDHVIAMNPIYVDEIAATIRELGVDTELSAV